MQWIPYRIGATNRNENSKGSVIPVRNEVRAAENSIPPTSFLLAGFASWYIAKAAAGSPNIINTNFPVRNFPAPW